MRPVPAADRWRFPRKEARANQPFRFDTGTRPSFGRRRTVYMGVVPGNRPPCLFTDTSGTRESTGLIVVFTLRKSVSLHGCTVSVSAVGTREKNGFCFMNRFRYPEMLTSFSFRAGIRPVRSRIPMVSQCQAGPGGLLLSASDVRQPEACKGCLLERKRLAFGCFFREGLTGLVFITSTPAFGNGRDARF